MFRQPNFDKAEISYKDEAAAPARDAGKASTILVSPARDSDTDKRPDTSDFQAPITLGSMSALLDGKLTSLSNSMHHLEEKISILRMHIHEEVHTLRQETGKQDAEFKEEIEITNNNIDNGISPERSVLCISTRRM